MADSLLRVESLTKTFYQVTANDRISLDVVEGEIHCFLGENGAGKSTLAECLYGFHRPDSGRIIWKGREVRLSSPADAISLGIGMVHQHFVLVPSLSVLENIVVGTEDAGLLLDLTDAEQRIEGLCRKYAVDLDLHARIRELPVGKQQWVEILKALFTRARLLVLDEPTAVLTPQESRTLFRILRQMTGEGISIVLISHKLTEVMQSDRVTILRKGKKIATVKTRESDKKALTRMMVGRDVEFAVLRSGAGEIGKPMLEIAGLCAKNESGGDVLKDLSLTVRAGEIVGIAGVAGNGQHALFETIVGVRPPVRGKIMLNGRDITGLTPKEVMACGIGFIPEDRFGEGLIEQFTVAENLVLGHHDQPAFSSRSGLLKRRRIHEFASSSIAEFEIATPSAESVVSTLSGGNAQKVVLARELMHGSHCILANGPSRGLDVGVIEYVHKRLLDKKREGISILLASEELEELFNIADRIAVIFRGEILRVFSTEDASAETIGLLMAGDQSPIAAGAGPPVRS